MPKKEEKTKEIPKPQKTSMNTLFVDEEKDIFKKENKKEEKKIIGLFADIEAKSPEKNNIVLQEKKEETKIKNIKPKIGIFDFGNNNINKEKNLQTSDNKVNVLEINNKKEINENGKGKEKDIKI